MLENNKSFSDFWNNLIKLHGAEFVHDAFSNPPTNIFNRWKEIKGIVSESIYYRKSILGESVFVEKNRESTNIDFCWSYYIPRYFVAANEIREKSSICFRTPEEAMAKADEILRICGYHLID